MGFATDHLIPALKPWMNPDFELYNEAIGKMFDPLSTVLEDSKIEPIEWKGAPFLSLAEQEACIPDPGWGPILNPRTFPAQFNPQYLGQYVGVTAPEGLTNAEDLVLIAEEQGFSRGTPTSILMAAKRGMKEGASPRILERTGPNFEEDGYHFLIIARGESLIGSIITKGNVKSGENKIKSTETAGMEVGENIVAIGFKPEAHIIKINSTTELEISENATITETGARVIAVSSSGVATLKSYVNYVKPAGLQWTLLTTGTYEEYEAAAATYKLNEEGAGRGTYAALELEPGA
jgi:hypothetical protein